MNWLESADHSLFKLVNQEVTHKLLDVFFPFITNLSNQDWFKYFALPAILLTWVATKKKKAIRPLFALILVAGVSDFLGYHVMKERIGRVRPNNHPEVSSVLRLPHSPKSGSFPSNHAMSTFAMMMLLSLLYPRWKWGWMVFASLVAYSRVYVGVHFPSDVLGGALLGCLLGLIAYKGLFVFWPYKKIL